MSIINNAVNTSLSGQTGTGNFVGSISPILVEPALGTPISGNLSNCTNIPLPAGTMFNFQQGQLTTVFTTGSTSYTPVTGLSVNITPTSSSNNVLVRTVVQVCSASLLCYFQLVRNSTPIGIGTSVGSRTAAGASTVTDGPAAMGTIVMEWLDTPATTSTVTYSVQAFTQGTLQVNSTNTDTNTIAYPRTSSIISVYEIMA